MPPVSCAGAPTNRPDARILGSNWRQAESLIRLAVRSCALPVTGGRTELRNVVKDPAMSRTLDWITLNSWAVAAVLIVAAVVGYAITRPAALRGASSDDPTAWLAFCMGLYPDTRPGPGDDPASTDDSGSGSDGGD